jgi:hypothetical protein
MCTVLLPPGGYPTEVNRYIISFKGLNYRLYLSVHNIFRHPVTSYCLDPNTKSKLIQSHQISLILLRRNVNIYTQTQLSLIIKTNKCTNMYCVYCKTHIKTLQKLLHVSIYRSSSGSTCSSLRSYVKMLKWSVKHFVSSTSGVAAYRVYLPALGTTCIRLIHDDGWTHTVSLPQMLWVQLIDLLMMGMGYARNM